MSVLAAGASVGTAQTHVSTEPGTRTLLMEEFTGQNCMYCPQGHRVCHDMMLTNPGKLITVNIHAGGYAVPGKGAPDFRTDEGEYLVSHFGVTGFPSGLLNRMAFDGRQIVYPPNSATLLHEQMDKPASVNIWNNAVYDAESRTLTVDVEAYFVKDCPDARLTVYLLQNDIEGPQLGSGNNISYLHAHMLRNVLTETMGDAITTTTAGSTFTRTLTMQIPDELNGVKYKPEDMQIVAFVTDASGEVLNASEAYTELHGLTPAVRAYISEPLIPIEDLWGYNFVECVLENRNDAPLTTAEFELTLGKNSANVPWSGSIAPHSAAQITLDIPEQIVLPKTYKRTLYRLRLTKANGEEITADSRLSGNITCPDTYPQKLIFTLQNDNRPEHNSWALYNCKDGSPVQEFEFGNANFLSKELTLEPGSYCLEVKDAWGDAGLNGDFAATIMNSDGTALFEDKYISAYGIRHFFKVTGDTGVVNVTTGNELEIKVYSDHVEAKANALVEVYSASGALLRSGRGSVSLEGLQGGMYMVRASAEGAVATAKAII